ncbi:MAG: sigma-70 family RNA polymerase sigma factor [Planctomycetes bacterium]|nr:sigma-70 family RNA polymerase sigma factor [Planctomycetota bacterium]
MSELAAAAASPAPAQTPPDLSAHTDADLFAGMALAGASVARAHACFAEFHRRHAAYLFAVCARRYREAAEEIVAETLRRVYESAPRFDRSALADVSGPDAARQLVRAWIGQIVRWVAADHFADRTRNAAVALDRAGPLSEPLSEPRTEPQSVAGRGAELVEQVRCVIEGLSAREQEIAWTVAHGWSPEHGQLRWSQEDLDAIGERFGLSRENIRQIRARLIRKLRARLEPLLNAGPDDR